MNLYAICPDRAPGEDGTTLILAETDEAALEHGIYVAAHDLVHPNYGSPTASVYLVAANLKKVGTAKASDAPAHWEWAHPAVEQALVDQADDEASWDAEERFRRGGER